MRSLRIPLLILVAAVFTLTGCDSNGLTEETTVPVSLSVSAVGQPGGTAAFLAKSGQGHIEITRARILLRTIQFHARDDDDFGDDDFDDDDFGDDDFGDDDFDDDDRSLDFRTNPLVVDLNLEGSPTEIEVTDIPEGIYHKISFRIHKPEDFETPPDPDFRIGPSGDERFSMIIEGTYDGQPFTYRSTKSMQHKIRLNPDLVVDGTFSGPLNVSMEIDMSRWFVDDDGTELNPTFLENGNESAIDRSLRDSFRAFRDNDRDGREDDDDDDFGDDDSDDFGDDDSDDFGDDDSDDEDDDDSDDEDDDGDDDSDDFGDDSDDDGDDD